MGRALLSVPLLPVGIALGARVGVADAPLVVVIGDVTSPRSVPDEVCVFLLLDVVEAELVMVGA
jgi:hypothetical protein